MPRRGQSPSDEQPSRGRPASTPEAREAQMVSLADQLAEKQLRDGTASSQVITHYLKMGSRRDQLERDKIALENELIKAKTKAIADQARTEEMFTNAIKAMRQYQGVSEPMDESQEYYESD